MQLQTTSPESKFPNEYSDVIFIQIDQHFENVIAKIQRGPDFMKHGVYRYIFSQPVVQNSDDKTVNGSVKHKWVGKTCVFFLRKSPLYNSAVLSNGYCTAELRRRISLASSVVASLQQI